MSLSIQKQITHSLHLPAQVGSVLWLTGFVASAYVSIMALPASARADEPLPGMARVTDGMSSEEAAKWRWPDIYTPRDPYTGALMSPQTLAEWDKHERAVRLAQMLADREAFLATARKLESERSRQSVKTGADAMKGRKQTPRTAAPTASRDVPWYEMTPAGSVPSDAQKMQAIGSLWDTIARLLPFDANVGSALEYSKEKGLIINVELQVTPDGSKSFVLLGKVGQIERAILAALWFSVNKRLQIFFSAERLEQDEEAAVSGTKYTKTQQAVGFGIRWAPNNEGLPKYIAFNMSASQSEDVDIAQWISREISWNSTLTYRHKEVFTGGTVAKFLPTITLDVGKNGEFTFGPSVAHRAYNDGSEAGYSFWGKAMYDHYWGEYGKTHLGIEYSLEHWHAEASHEARIPGTSLSVGPRVLYGWGGDVTSDVRAILGMRLPFGGGVQSASSDRPKASGVGEIWQNTLDYARGMQSHYVFGKEKYTKTLESSVSNAPGSLGTCSLTNDGGISTSDGKLNVQPRISCGIATGGARNEVSTDGTTWVNIGSANPFQFGTTAGLAALADGSYTVRVRAVSASGVAGPESTLSIELNTVAITKTGESFPNLDTAGGNYSGTVTFSKVIKRVVSVSMDNGWTASVTAGLNTITVTVSGTAGADPATITLVVEDEFGNQLTVTMGPYNLF